MKNHIKLRRLAGGLLTVGSLLALSGCGGSSGGFNNNTPAADKVIRVWMTTSVRPPGSGAAVTFTQQDRLARPVVNEVFGTISQDPPFTPGTLTSQGVHRLVNHQTPAQDRGGKLAAEIRRFVLETGGDTPEKRKLADALIGALTPDMMVANLSKSGPASYLGSELGGGFGGRKLTDDVVDISLAAVFGTAVDPTNTPIPSLLSDNVGPQSNIANADGSPKNLPFPFVPPPA